MNINCNGKLMDLSQPKVMGILNITPDSFFDGGKYTSTDKIENRVEQIITEGADFIDLGAVSTRPGAVFVDENEELKRLCVALEIIRKKYPEAIVSVDTFRANVAEFVVKNYNVNIINDIFASNGSENMAETIAKLQIPYIIMHIQGTPETMQLNPKYNDVVLDILHYFSVYLKKLNLLGVNDIIVDPGFGFGKTIDHNYELLNRLDEFKIIGLPILVGISRKSMIYRYLSITPEDSLAGTITLNTLALLKGANILRVHDVAEAVQTIKILKKFNESAREI